MSFDHPSFRILASRQMTYSPRITHSMEHTSKLRHKPLPTFLSRSRDLVTPRQTLSMATSRGSGLTKSTDWPWPNLGPRPTFFATRSNSTISLSRVLNSTSSLRYLLTRAQKRLIWALFISSLVCTLMPHLMSSRSRIFLNVFHFLKLTLGFLTRVPRSLLTLLLVVMVS